MAEWLWNASGTYARTDSFASADEGLRLIDQSLSGGDGSTSLKGTIAARLPVINDAPSFRAARNLLMDLGGPAALFEELVFSGLVDSQTGLLEVEDKPYNIFARIGSGHIVQSHMESAQVALGTYSNKYCVVANMAQNDLHWDSSRKNWIKKASMSRRHRFLTTKNMHWQWFNPIVFGLVNPEQGGVSPAQALAEVEEMKAAALMYTTNSGEGWSQDIGLFMNIFGHNNVNSLFVHIVDLSEVGPAFHYQEFKNCPIDDVLKILKEDVVAKLLPSPAVSSERLALLKREAGWRRSLRGKDGATSIKEELKDLVPKCRDASNYREARRLLLEELGGVEALKSELVRSGFIAPDTHMLTTGTKPFNVFARIASDVIKQDGMELEQEWLGDFRDQFVVARNLPANDMHWDDDDEAWVGKASMAKNHRFLTVKDLHWQWFNAITFGLVPVEDGGSTLKECIARVELMKAAATVYAKEAGWSPKVGFFFHVFGHNSVNSLHLHIIDMEQLGPTFWYYEYKNCPLDAILKVLKEEYELFKVKNISSVMGSSQSHRSKNMMNQQQSTRTNQRTKIELKEAQILDLNVGGIPMCVPVSTFEAAPAGSLLSRLFAGYGEDDWTSTLPKDPYGRLYLNYPHAAFEVLVDHLRLLCCTPHTCTVDPPLLKEESRQAVELVAWNLGVGNLLEEPQRGHAFLSNAALSSFKERPRAWILHRFCNRRMRAPPPSSAPRQRAAAAELPAVETERQVSPVMVNEQQELPTIAKVDLPKAVASSNDTQETHAPAATDDKPLPERVTEDEAFSCEDVILKINV